MGHYAMAFGLEDDISRILVNHFEFFDSIIIDIWDDYLPEIYSVISKIRNVSAEMPIIAAAPFPSEFNSDKRYDFISLVPKNVHAIASKLNEISNNRR